MTTAGELAERSAAFAQDVQMLLDGVLPGPRRIVSVEYDHRYVVRPEGESASEQVIPLSVDGDEYAHLTVRLFQELDRLGRHLKTSRSDIAVYSSLDRNPLLRLEYRADLHTDPVCHWQLHAERGAFTALLGQAHRLGRVSHPHRLSKLHIPVGGERFRPGLEDVLEFLVRDCGVDCQPGWQPVVADSRQVWRRRQLRAAVRDLQEDAADALREEGWALEPPEEPQSAHFAPYRRW